MTDSSWVVHKFGGSSVADAECFRRVAQIAESGSQPQAIVLSACRGVTDGLLGLVRLAEQEDMGFETRLGEIRERHISIAEGLLRPGGAAAYLSELKSDCRDI